MSRHLENLKCKEKMMVSVAFEQLSILSSEILSAILEFF
jgi:hypothetical protein